MKSIISEKELNSQFGDRFTVLNRTPLIENMISGLREIEEGSEEKEIQRVRGLVKGLTIFTLDLALRDERMTKLKLITPVEETTGQVLSKLYTAIPIIRAGEAMLEPVLESLEGYVNVGGIWMKRNHDTLKADILDEFLPDDVTNRTILLLDIMNATGGSLSDSIEYLKGKGVEGKDIKILNLFSAPEGIKHILASHSDVSIYTAVLDRELNNVGYICPGLGDAGDRCLGEDTEGKVVMDAVKKKGIEINEK